MATEPTIPANIQTRPRPIISHGVVNVGRYDDLTNLPEGVSEQDVLTHKALTKKLLELIDQSKPRTPDEIKAYEDECIKLFAEQKPRLDLAVNGHTLLIDVIQSGMQRLAITMVERMQQENALDQLFFCTPLAHRFSPLHLAVHQKPPQLALVRKLIDVFEGQPERLQQFVLLTDHSHKTVMGYCFSNANQRGESQVFAEFVPLLTELANKGIPMGLEVGGRGWPILHRIIASKDFAQRKDLQDLADLIIKQGCVGLNDQNEGGFTPLAIAYKADAKEYARHLIRDFGARVDIIENSMAGDYKPAVFVGAVPNQMEERLTDLLQEPVPVAQLHRLVKHSHAAISRPDDMIDEFCNRVVMPAVLMEMGYGQDPEVTRMIQSSGEDFMDQLHANSLQLELAIARAIAPTPTASVAEMERPHPLSADMRQAMRVSRLSRTWHHPTINFPNGLRKLRPQRMWQPLLKETFSNDEASLVALTTSDELAEESRALEHCVGKTDYDQKCCATKHDDRSHIVSIRDSKGMPQATIELKIQPASPDDVSIDLLEAPQNVKGLSTNSQAEGFSVAVKGTPVAIYIEQFKALKNATPSAKEKLFFREFLKALDADPGRWLDLKAIAADSLGAVANEPDQHPDIAPVLKQRVQYDPLDPTESPDPWEAINRRFDVYRRSDRRASLISDERKRIYDDVPGLDPNHFIAGYTTVKPGPDGSRKHALDESALGGGETVSLRQLDVKSFMRATGVLEAMHQHIRDQFPEIAQKREAIWAEEARTATLQQRDVPETEAERNHRVRDIARHGKVLEERVRRETNPYMGG